MHVDILWRFCRLRLEHSILFGGKERNRDALLFKTLLVCSSDGPLIGEKPNEDAEDEATQSTTLAIRPVKPISRH